LTWEESLRWLLALERRGVKLDLTRMRAALEALNRPQASFSSILVAGTNGKGSTAAALASALRLSGRSVGLYTSPHLLDYRERIRLNGKLADSEAMRLRVERDREIWDRFELSFFEATTALAFSHFRETGVEVAVLEVGLGGRLDATNTVEPVLSVITPLGMDHAHLLGSTRAAIAREKAGILRPGVPAAVAGGRRRRPKRWNGGPGISVRPFTCAGQVCASSAFGRARKGSPFACEPDLARRPASIYLRRGSKS